MGDMQLPSLRAGLHSPAPSLPEASLAPGPLHSHSIVGG